MVNNLKTIITLLFLGLCITLGIKDNKNKKILTTSQTFVNKDVVFINSYNISNSTPSFLTYPQIINQLKTWHSEAPNLTELSVYGKSKLKNDFTYFKITNQKINKNKPRVLVISAIHGNEPWATSCVMAYIGNLLEQYGKNEEVTNLIDSRELYFIPVVSPDSYTKDRLVDGIDPNRDFPQPNIPNSEPSHLVSSLIDFFNQIKPNATISAHTFGRIILTPYGDLKQVCPNESDYQRIAGKMANMCDYKYERSCNNYGYPIYGTESDWFYRNGAFAITMEFGTHQTYPSLDEIKTEFNRTWKGFLYFCDQGPLVKIKRNKEDFDFSSNTGISENYHLLQKIKISQQHHQ